MDAYLRPLVSLYANHQADKVYIYIYIYLFIIILYNSSITDIEAVSKLYCIWSTANPPSEIVTTIYFCNIYNIYNWLIGIVD